MKEFFARNNNEHFNDDFPNKGCGYTPLVGKSRDDRVYEDMEKLHLA